MPYLCKMTKKKKKNLKVCIVLSLKNTRLKLYNVSHTEHFYPWEIVEK